MKSEVILSGCAIIRNNSILLLKKFKNSYYELPGGKVDYNESIEDAAIRECFEEIGCKVFLKNKFGEYEFFHKEKNVHSNIFIAQTADEPKIIEKEIFENMIWMPLNEYEKYTLAPNVKMFIEDYLSQ